jgi:exopolysaccharide biosynthesis WecB/TagA/CpsF family protein
LGFGEFLVLPDTGVITWVNHYSVLKCIEAKIPLEEFDFVGIDGFFLRFIHGAGISHSSADYSFPVWLKGKTLSVGLIGGSEISALAHIVSFTNEFPNASVAWSLAGDENWLENTEAELSDVKRLPDLILVGMGAPLQDSAALRIFERVSGIHPDKKILVATCGGWLDQIGIKNYYPKWSTPLKLNWLVRLVREPGRLWKRYFLDSFVALGKYYSIRRYLQSVRNFL